MLRNSFIALLSFGLIFLVLFLTSGRNARTLHYDEMQLKIRGDAYKFGFYTVVLLLALTGLLYVTDDTNTLKFITTDMQLFLILYVGVTVFVVYSISKNAFFRVLEKGTRYLLLCAFLIASNGISLMQCIQSGRFLKNGILELSNGGVNVLNLICFMMISGAILIQKFGRNGEEDEES